MADVSCSGKSLSMGPGTHIVPLELFADNRSRLICNLRQLKQISEGAVVFLQGGASLPFYNTDVDYVFRQEPFFQWAFGVREPGCAGAIHVATGKSVLFVERLPDSYAIWMGKLPTLDEFKEKYAVDRVAYFDEIKDVLLELSAEKTLLVLDGVNSDSGLSMAGINFEGVNEFNLNKDILWPVMTECRVIKSPLEIEVIRYSNKISSNAHRLIMNQIRPGMMEYQAESIFLGYCYFVGGCRHVSYTCICGSGENAATLHYGHAAAPNDKMVSEKDICLFDMGCCYFGYASDITCSFPASGKFTDDQKFIYNAVLAARDRVNELAKPGVSWVDMHEESYRTMLGALKKGGLLVGDVEEMIKAGVGAIFQPHGLGHLLGLDVHDVGGYPKDGPPRPTEPGFSKLRTARILEAGMVLTVEPGCYFIDKLLDDALADPKLAKYFVPDVLQRFRGFGGVRIEDDVLITKTGVEVLTTVPRTVEEIEELMAGHGNLEEVLTKDAHNHYAAMVSAVKKAVVQ